MVYLTISFYNLIFNKGLFNHRFSQDSVRSLQHNAVWKKFQALVQNNPREDALEMKVVHTPKPWRGQRNHSKKLVQRFPI